MTTQEFETQFDVLFNNITSNQAPGLNAYEKSVLLTKAEMQITQEYLNPRVDGAGGGFDGSPRRQIDFSSITESKSFAQVLPASGYVPVDSRAICFDAASSIGSPISIINEAVDYTVSGVTTTYTVVPITFQEYQRLMLKPYKYPVKGQAWRLINKGLMEIIGRNLTPSSNATYRIRYVRKPNPIILEPRLDLLYVSIDGIGYGDGTTYTWTPTNTTGTSTLSECELPEEIHQEILERAVTLAKIAWQGTTMTQTAMAVQANKK